MSASKTASLDIDIKERSVAFIRLAAPRSRPVAAWKALALEVIHFQRAQRRTRALVKF